MSNLFRLRFLPGIAIAALLAACDTGPDFEYVHLPGTEPDQFCPVHSPFRIGGRTSALLSPGDH